ncbi:MAG: hypothetical protein A4E28_01491 [Methanocella sp. PtaU1.Bin125]|nr:MAG: hypothetical protein A4E28_01491 [Methanocella sp. PtaU1.Bin125]
MKSSVTGTVEIKKCGFNTRPKLMAAGEPGDEDSLVDILPGAFQKYEGQKVKVTIETAGPAKPAKPRRSGKPSG